MSRCVVLRVQTLPIAQFVQGPRGVRRMGGSYLVHGLASKHVFAQTLTGKRKGEKNEDKDDCESYGWRTAGYCP